MEFRNMKVSTASLTHGILSIDYLCLDLEKLLRSNICSNLLKDIQNGMMSFRFFLQTIKGNHLVEDTIDHHEVQDVIKRCLNISYGAVAIIDNIVENEETSGECMESISNLLEQITHTNVEISKIFGNGLLKHQVISGFLTPQGVDSSHVYEKATAETTSHLSLPNAIVGFEEELSELKEMLMRNPYEFDAISITGMPGLGKTTLAQELYKDKALVHMFDVRLWCTVSSNYNKTELVRQLLSQLGDETKDGENAVRRKLLGKKFFIVLDDVWNPMVWEDIRPLLPMQNNGSRVVLTSRDEEVARSAKCQSEPYVLPLRSPDQSWEILKGAVFKNTKFPIELEDIGRTIATECRGLPLTTVLVAGILNNAHRKRASWLEIGVNISTKSKLEDKFMSAIEQSYRHLPDHIKLCFLYLATFREDEPISVVYLLSMWIAHKFVPLLDQMAEGANFTDKAEACLQDLISRNLVMVHKSESFKELDMVAVHDLIHEFCLKKAEEENFLCLPRSTRDEFTRDFHTVVCNLHCQETRNIAPTLLFTDDTSILRFDKYPKVYYSKITPFIQIITVLQVGTKVNPHEFLDRSISQLIHLRYLAVRFYQTWIDKFEKVETLILDIPSSIAKLRKLQTLILNTMGYGVGMMVPHTFFEMTNLRHVEVFPNLRLPKYKLDCSKLVHLEFLSRLILFPENLDIIYLPNLRNLTFEIEAESTLPILETPRNLECLIVGRPASGLPMCILSNLRELSLYESGHQWSELSSMIFPNLEVLELVDRAFVGKTWETNTASFPSLKYLKIRDLHIKQWNLSEEPFRKLVHLVLDSCRLLQNIPSGFASVITLQSISVDRCSPAVGNSALEIRDELSEMGIEISCKIGDLLRDYFLRTTIYLG